MENPKVWILEDEARCNFVYDEILRESYSISFFPTISELRRAIVDHPLPAVLIADLRLPDGSFFQFLSTTASDPIRALPYLIVSSVDDEDILHHCLWDGASDFLTKPFNRNELRVKVDRLFKQSSQAIKVDFLNRQIALNEDISAHLTPRELQIFVAVSESNSQRIKRSQLISKVWSDVKVGSRTLDVHIHNLRRKLQALGYTLRFTPPDIYQLMTEQPGQPGESDPTNNRNPQ